MGVRYTFEKEKTMQKQNNSWTFERPDYDPVAGKQRATLPPKLIRAIPLVGLLVGAAFAYGAGDANLSRLTAGILVGAWVGSVTYYYVAHKLGRDLK